MPTKVDALPQELQDRVRKHFAAKTKEELLAQLLRRLTNSDILKAIADGGAK